MADVVPKHETGAVTCHASAAIIGGRLVALSGAPVGGNPSVGVPAATAKVYGVAARDAASGAKVGVYTRPGTHIWVEAGAALAANDVIEANATGQAIVRTAGIAVGLVVEGQATVGQLALVDFRPANS